MTESIVPQSACPNCNRLMDRATGVSDQNAVPKPGDLTLCISCAAISRYGDQLQLQPLEFGALEQIALDNPRGYRYLVVAQKHILEKIRSKK